MSVSAKAFFSAPSGWTVPFGVLWLLLVSGVTAWCTSAMRDMPLNGAIAPGDVVQLEAEAAGFPVVTTSQVRDIVASGSHMLLDARPRDQFAEDHLPGAMSLPITDFEQSFAELAPVLMSGMPIMVYCTGPRCDESLQLAERLREAGFSMVEIYVEGMEGWMAREAEPPTSNIQRPTSNGGKES